MINIDVIYICDRKKCEHCSYPKCKHTTDINHAANFKKKISWDGEPVFMEKEDMAIQEAFERLNRTLKQLAEIGDD